jgi:hypothetical protein
VTDGANPLAALYAPSMVSALGSEVVVLFGEGSSVVIALATWGMDSSEFEDDLSINPVPLASGESGFPMIGQTVSLCPSLILEAVSPEAGTLLIGANTPILSNFDTCCGIGDGRVESEFFVVIIEGFARFPRLALRINPLSSSSLFDSLDSRPSSIGSFLHCFASLESR